MRVSYRTLAARALLAIIKVLASVVKVCAMLVIGSILVIAGFRLCVPIGLYVAGYSDGALYSAGMECVVNTIGVNVINEEAAKIFADGKCERLSDMSEYSVNADSCLCKVSRELSSPYTWERTLFGGCDALVLRFGCHYNYAWLVIVDPGKRICYKGKENKVKRIEDNICICFDTSNIGY
jgi:hypothetical protein